MNIFCLHNSAPHIIFFGNFKTDKNMAVPISEPTIVLNVLVLTTIWSGFLKLYKKLAAFCIFGEPNTVLKLTVLITS